MQKRDIKVLSVSKSTLQSLIERPKKSSGFQTGEFTGFSRRRAQRFEPSRYIGQANPVLLVNNTHGDQSRAVRFLNHCPIRHLIAVPLSVPDPSGT